MSFIPAKKYSLSSGMKYGFFALGATLIAIALAFIYTTTISNQLTDPSQAAAVTLTVDSTLDTGDATPGDDLCDDGAGNCTLRAAIEEANGDTDTDSIHFNITANEGAGPHTIIPATELPGIDETVVIDASTEPGASCNANNAHTLMVSIDGSSAGASDDGLTFNNGSDGSVVRGLNIHSFGDAAIQMNSSATNGSNIIQCNFLGTDIGGTTALPNQNGLSIHSSADNTIGTNGDNVNDDSEGNIISGNSGHGIIITDALTTGTVVAGNYIGVDASGTADLGNGDRGVSLTGSPVNTRIGTNGDGISDAQERNIISGNDSRGVFVSGAATTGSIIAGNYIGTNAAGTAGIANTDEGIRLQASSNTNIIGVNSDGSAGEANEGNLISGNGSSGIAINNSDSNIVAGNYIGTDTSGTLDLGNTADGILIENSSDSNSIGTNGDGTNDLVERNIISGNGDDGVELNGSTVNIVAGNFIGTDVSGALALGNVSEGVIVSSGDSNVIGANGDASAGEANEGNVLSGNLYGVTINNANHTTVAGNHIGINAAGDASIQNNIGVWIQGTSSNNTLGGVEVTDRNVISGNLFEGIRIRDLGGDTSSNFVFGNYIGTNSAGDAAVGNGNSGVYIDDGASSNYIGTDGDGSSDIEERNIISGNGSHGVQVVGAGVDNNIISGNYIGVDVSGAAALANVNDGVIVQSSAGSTTIGTNGDGSPGDVNEGNVISANGRYGVYLTVSSSNQIAGNHIGVDVSGMLDLGNADKGIRIINDAHNNMIGTDGDGTSDVEERNVISGNGSDGITLQGTASTSATNNTIAGNYIGVLSDGVTPLGNNNVGIRMQRDADNNIIGGTLPVQRNIIGGNGTPGILITSSLPSFGPSDNNLIHGNYIGVGADGVANVGNGDRGVQISNEGSGNQVGGLNPGEGNTFMFNGDTAIGMSGGSGTASHNNPVLSNIFRDNGNIAIDNPGVVREVDINDPTDLADYDGVGNFSLNHPIPLSISSTANPSIDIYLDVDTTDTTDFIVQLYDNPSGIDSSGHGEGEVYIDTQSITGVTPAPSTIADGTYTLNFTGTISDPANISLTITEDLGGGTYGSTSEFSAPTAQYIQGRVFTDTNYNSTDDGNAVDPGTNAVTYNVYHDTDSNGLIEPANDRLVYSGTTQDNVYAAEPGEYQAILSSAGDFLVEIDDTSTAISTSYIPTGPYQADTLPGSILNSSGSGPHTITFDQTLLASMGYGDPDGDVDGDGVGNGDEATVGTNPNNSDSDGDNISDGVELDAALECSLFNTPLSDYASIATAAGTDLDGLTVSTNITGLDIDHTIDGPFDRFKAYSGFFLPDPYEFGDDPYMSVNGSTGNLAEVDFGYEFSQPVSGLVAFIADMETEAARIVAYRSGVEVMPVNTVVGSQLSLNSDDLYTQTSGNVVWENDYRNQVTYYYSGLVDRVVVQMASETTGGVIAGFDAGCIGATDTDQDGTINPLDPDSDNDGLLDGTEDTNANGTVDEGETDPTNPDTDGDTLLDGDEDLNSNGSVDIGETDPRSADTDNDGDTDNVDICPLDPDNNCDGDNIPTEVENMGPNNGDSNNDGILDSLQASVASAPNQYAPAYQDNSTNPDNMAFTSMVLNTATSTCDTIDTLSFTNEASLSVQDDNYDYPLGLIDFEVSCTTNGDTADITYILDTQYDTEDWTWRKYQPHTQEYSDITDRVTFGTITIDDQTKTTATIQVTDGESLDDDETENGTILDPSGPAVLSEELSDTGTPAYSFVVMGAVVVMVGMVVKGLGKTRRYRLL